MTIYYIKGLHIMALTVIPFDSRFLRVFSRTSISKFQTQHGDFRKLHKTHTYADEVKKKKKSKIEEKQ